MKDQYLVTDGRTERAFDYTPEGLRAAWEFQQTLRHSVIQNPNRVDLRADDSGPDDGLTEADQELLDEFDAEAYAAEHADEIAADRYWDQRIDEARGK